MKKAICLVALLHLLICSACSKETKEQQNQKSDNTVTVAKNENSSDSKPLLELLWETPKTLKVPESVMYDSKRDRLYVSNIDGQPTGKDGKGFISILSTDGRIVSLEWVSGLNAPKGMGISGDYLYVTDIDRIVEIDIEKAVITNTFKPAGARFLNDIAIDSRGIVYVSDMQANCIYRLENGTVSKWLDLPGPNGMLFIDGALFAGSSADGTLYEINIKDKTKKALCKNTGGIDGLKQYDGQTFIVSDWSGATSLLTLDGKIISLLNTTKDKAQSADLEYIKDKNLLLIPTFNDNRVVAYKLM